MATPFDEFYKAHPEWVQCYANTQLLRESYTGELTVHGLEQAAARLSDRLAKPKPEDEPEFVERSTEIRFAVFNDFAIEVTFTDNVSRTCGRLGTAEALSRNTHAVTVYTEGESRCYIIFPFGAKPGVVAHESFHAVRHMLNALGIPLENEIVAYSLGYLVEQIHQFKFQ